MEIPCSNYFSHEDEEEQIELPPGFRFHPTDEELITHYLSPKVLDDGFRARAIGEVDLNKCEPWELPGRGKMGEKEWYFFYLRDRKYPTGLRTNRATGAGYWKATGKDKEIYRKKTLVGMKKTLVFYKGRAPKGLRTNWVMHEYRLEGNQLSLFNLTKTSNKNEWVICRVFEKGSDGKRTHVSGSQSRPTTSEPNSLPLPPLMDSSPHSCAETGLTEPAATGATAAYHVTCFSDNFTKHETESDMSYFIDSNNNLENLQISEHDDEMSVLRMFLGNYGLNSAASLDCINNDPFGRC